MIDLLGQVLVPGGADKALENEAEMIERLSEFASWISIFGSDDAVKSFHNFMQGAFHAAPAPITLRLYADFVLAARRDMGDPRNHCHSGPHPRNSDQRSVRRGSRKPSDDVTVVRAVVQDAWLGRAMVPDSPPHSRRSTTLSITQ